MMSISGLKLINAESNIVPIASEKPSVVYNTPPCVSASHVCYRQQLQGSDDTVLESSLKGMIRHCMVALGLNLML